jgi:osmotically inducible protein OsmC
MPTRTARTEWNGGLRDGSGKVELVSSGLATYEVSFPKRAADVADGSTSPEELIAAAHSSCYAMQLSALLAQVGGTPERLEVQAEADLAPDPAGGYQISEIRLDVTGTVAGVDAETFERVADEAKKSCPVSKALTGTSIALQARLA